jgi:expansin (peptidoglycan-binding protein)
MSRLFRQEGHPVLQAGFTAGKLPQGHLKSVSSGTLAIAAAFAVAVALAAALAVDFAPAAGQGPGDQTVWLPLVAASRPNSNPIHSGVATYYHASGAGACSFDPSPDDLMVAAMNAEEYDQAATCGAYIFVSGPKGAVTVRIVDLCPGCKAGHLDLSQEAFEQIAELSWGRVPISWQVVSPALDGPIAYHFKPGSNQWWTAVQIRNHRNPVARLEYLDGGGWVAVPRTAYNYFVQTEPGMGPGPYTFRVTDAYGNTLTDSGIPHVEGETVEGAAQFPYGP